MIKYTFQDLVIKAAYCGVVGNTITMPREMLAVINASLEDVKNGSIDDENFRWMNDEEEVREFIEELYRREEQFQEAYYSEEDNLIICNFADEGKFIIDPMGYEYYI